MESKTNRKHLSSHANTLCKLSNLNVLLFRKGKILNLWIMRLFASALRGSISEV